MPPPSTPKSLSESRKILDKPKLQITESAKKPIKELITQDFDSMLQIIFWNSLGFFFFGFLIPYASLEILGSTGIELGFTVSSMLVGGLITAPIVGYLTDKYSKKKLVLFGSFGRGIAYIIMYLSINLKSQLGFMFGIFFLGFSVGFFWTPLDALISQKSHKTYRATAFGKRGGMIGKGNLVGSLISLVIFGVSYTLIPSVTWLVYSPLILFTLSNFYAGIIFFKNTDEHLTYDDYISSLNHEANPTISENQNENALKNEISTKNHNDIKLYIGFIVFMIAFMLTSINQTLSNPFLQGFLIENFVQNPILIMLIYFPSEMIAQLLAPKLGILADRVNPRITILITGSLGASITWLLINSPSAWIFGLLLVFDTVFAWLGMLILQNFLSRFSTTNRGKIFGIRQWVSLLGGVIGPIIGGYAWVSLSHTAPFIISIFVELTLIPLFIIALFTLKPYVAEKI